MNGYTLLDNGPTLGDLIDCELASERNNAYAIYRLLERWLSPKPTMTESAPCRWPKRAST